MSKTVFVQTGDYRIKVSDQNEIILDTGATGITRVTGDLIVEGETTTVNTTNLDVEDNVILVNKGENGYSVSVSGQQAGLRVDRGQNTDVQFVYDETVEWNDPVSQTTSQGPGIGQSGGQGVEYGAFKTVSATGDYLALRTRNINSDSAIYFEPGSGADATGAGSVHTLRIIKAGYENLLSDDNDIPNKKYVDDEVNAVVIGAAFPRIVEGDSEVRVFDDSQSGPPSRIDFTLNGNLVARYQPTILQIYQDVTEIGSIRFQDDKIAGMNTNQDLELVAPGVGSIRVNDSMVINNTPSEDDALIDPAFDVNGVKLYSKTPAGGDTGLFYVNTNNTRGEVVSKNRALLFGMLF